jgi:phosphoribosyl 1,2-cyclic phosphate phosphodiesterase
MSLTLTILGCGSSGGVPRIGNHWGACDPENPRNRRRRCSVMLERRRKKEATRVLIDTSPDLRDQLLDYGAGVVDAVLFTHEHADHTHGIDELRAVALNLRRRVPVWANDRTGTMLLGRFGYCFYTPPGSDYPAILTLHRLIPGEPVTIDGAGGPVTALPFNLEHGNIRALGFRMGDVAYTPDLNGVPEESLEALSGLDTWIVDALKLTPHASHFSLDEALEWIARLAPRRAILTNLHIDLDYAALVKRLPEGVEPAYDGMTVEIEH